MSSTQSQTRICSCCGKAELKAHYYLAPDGEPAQVEACPVCDDALNWPNSKEKE